MGLTQIYKGAGTSTPIFKKYGTIFYDQTSMGLPVCNVKGSKVWAGAANSKALLTIVATKAFSGASTSNCVFHYEKGIIFKGAGPDMPLYRWAGSHLYQGAGSAKIVLNWTGNNLTLIDVFASILLLQTTYKVR